MKERQILYDFQCGILKKKKKPVIDRTDWWLPETGRDEMGEGSQKVQNSNYKISKSRGCNVQHGDYS